MKTPTEKMNDDLLAEGLHEAFCIVRDSSVEVVGACNCRLRNPPSPAPLSSKEALRSEAEASAAITARADANGTGGKREPVKSLEERAREYADEMHESDFTAYKASLWGLKQGEANARLANTVIEQLQRANKVSEDALKKRVEQLTEALEKIRDGGAGVNIFVAERISREALKPGGSQ